MDEAKIRFGDRLFIYGKMTDQEAIDELGLYNPEYNSVVGYTATGGYYMVPQKTDQVDVCLPGFVVDVASDYLGSTGSLALRTLFSRMEMIDVTNLLSKQDPSLSGTKVWMPIP